MAIKNSVDPNCLYRRVHRHLVLHGEQNSSQLAEVFERPAADLGVMMRRYPGAFNVVRQERCHSGIVNVWSAITPGDFTRAEPLVEDDDIDRRERGSEFDPWTCSVEQFERWLAETPEEERLAWLQKR